MKKLILLLICILSITALAACDGKDDTPEGMQLVYGGEDAGYYFYAPEEWLISNVGDIKAAYISRVNTTSVSFSEVEFETDGDRRDYFFNKYFDEHLPQLQKMPKFTLKENGKTTVFGTGEYGATNAKQYIYTYEHLDFEFSFMQILVEKDGRFFIFTYSALNTAENGAKSNYEKYLEMAQSVIENFRFVSGGTPSTDTATYERDADGYILISDKKLSGFDLYVPDTFVPSYSSAIVSASHSDGSSINLTKATSTGLSADKYWEVREAELSEFFSDVRVIQKEIDTELGNSDSVLFGNWDWAYEYTYVHEGNTYHVYQILAINGQDGYVFTYTALEENYTTHFDEILKVIEKVHF